MSIFTPLPPTPNEYTVELTHPPTFMSLPCIFMS
jgi:hypothetical protein